MKNTHRGSVQLQNSGGLGRALAHGGGPRKAGSAEAGGVGGDGEGEEGDQKLHLALLWSVGIQVQTAISSKKMGAFI